MEKLRPMSRFTSCLPSSRRRGKCRTLLDQEPSAARGRREGGAQQERVSKKRRFPTRTLSVFEMKVRMRIVQMGGKEERV